jgi:hypothetical protein
MSMLEEAIGWWKQGREVVFCPSSIPSRRRRLDSISMALLEKEKGQPIAALFFAIPEFCEVQILTRSPSLGQIQYMPPGIWRYLTT